MRFPYLWGVLKKAPLLRCSVVSGPHLPRVNSGPHLRRALHIGLFQHALRVLEAAAPIRRDLWCRILSNEGGITRLCSRCTWRVRYRQK
jgi:hypothetical protein